ncbi:MAG: hypothetical protein KF851_02310 [Pirellulaceae bacterium]|jgi:hypothetical protein|nr:hypothetical protein [Pirellulaceae bacterium]
MNRPIQSSSNVKTNLPPIAHVICGWPLLLVLIGGAIGGILGAAAYVVNLAIYKTELPAPVKVVLNVVVGFAAIGIWVVIALAIRAAFS